MIFTLPHKTKTLWQIRVVFVIVFLCFVSFLFGRNLRWYIIPTILAFGSVITFIYLPLYLKSYKITVDIGFIGITKGVLIKSTHIMPYPRLIYAQSFTTPLSSLFKMKIVLLKAARGWLFVPEMEYINSKHLLDHIRMSKNDTF